MTEPARPPYSLSPAALPAFFHALADQTETDPIDALPDNAIYSTRHGIDFHLVFNAAGPARHLALAGTFVEAEGRLHLDWKMETAVPAKLVPYASGILALLVFLIGLTSKEGPELFTMIPALGLGLFCYGNFHRMNTAKIDTEKLLLECIQKCIVAAEFAPTAEPLQSSPTPTEPTP